jgi:trans-aconitate methyltransferase
MPEWDGLAVLDAGCGDGAFMHDLLHGHPAYVRLEDFVQSWTVMAYGRLLQDADRVEAVTADVRTVDDATLYDVVLALGVFDYDSDWPGLLHRLMCRSKGIVVADFPRAGTLHSWVRQIWLGAHGINLQSTNRKRLDLLFERVGASAQVEELPLQWIARIRISH